MCAIKVDLFKAYEMANYDFHMVVLKSIGFHSILISWIKECITTLSYLVYISGDLEGFFRSSRGLRQGDPISSYLFVIIMEVFSRILGKLSKDKRFKFH